MPLLASLSLGRRSDNGTHCGVFYLTLNGNIEMLHFNHRSIQSVSTWPNYMEVPTTLLDAQRLAISDQCRHFAAKYGHDAPPFSPIIPRRSRNGSVIFAPGTGFTCATFVDEMFRARGFELVDLETWPDSRAEDKQLFKKIFAIFRRSYPLDCGHFDAVEATTVWKRIRPEELCAAAKTAPPPATYPNIKNRVKRLLEDLIHLYKPIS